MTMTNQQQAGGAIFELVRFVDGVAHAYVPYSSGCSNCCGATPTAATPSCCGH